MPGQCAVQTALGGYQSIHELTQKGGRLYQSRQAVLQGVAEIPGLSLVEPRGALYAFIRVQPVNGEKFDDRTFALSLLESKHVLIAPGSSFNVAYRDHFRITLLPDERVLKTVFQKMGEHLEHWGN